jgi:hypothetical protein
MITTEEKVVCYGRLREGLKRAVRGWRAARRALREERRRTTVGGPAEVEARVAEATRRVMERGFARAEAVPDEEVAAVPAGASRMVGDEGACGEG